MKKYILALLFLPFISCANNTNTIPEIAYGIQTEITTDGKKNVIINGITD